ncbi:MAG: carbon-nitrogen hydrolase family protein, partial [Polaribacter sp.]|nr:carbon-nitrogen hydrolase family protein [Polaribacter sp.]
MTKNLLKVALAQISPVWLNKEKTIEKIEKSILDAAKENCELIVFGEALLPGYPFWIALTNGVEWDSKTQKELHAHYVRNSITIEKGELDSICRLAKKNNIAIYLGIMERAQNRGGHSIYASLVYINAAGEIKS